LQKKKVQLGIKVKKNSIISCNNNKFRNKEVIFSDKRSVLRKKKKRKYGQRRMAIETAFSSINRIYGEYASSIKFQNMVKEIMLKVSLYNLFRRVV
jgi:hypothetical protein